MVLNAYHVAIIGANSLNLPQNKCFYYLIPQKKNETEILRDLAIVIQLIDRWWKLGLYARQSGSRTYYTQPLDSTSSLKPHNNTMIGILLSHFIYEPEIQDGQLEFQPSSISSEAHIQLGCILPAFYFLTVPIPRQTLSIHISVPFSSQTCLI